MGEATGHFFDTLRVLVGREFRMRYKGSFFGILWAIISPLGTVAVLHYVFTNILALAIPHFAIFIYSALLPWTWFQTSVQTGASTLSDNRSLVRTPFFSKPLLPWAVTCTNFLLYLLALPVIFALMSWDGVPFTSALLALPAIWAVQWILTLGFTVLIAAIGVVVRDAQHFMTLILVLWFYLTPIFYDVSQIAPESAWWLSYNPMTPLVTAHRNVMLYGRMPDWQALGSITVASVGILIVSLLVFRGLEDSFIDQA